MENQADFLFQLLV